MKKKLSLLIVEVLCNGRQATNTLNFGELKIEAAGKRLVADAVESHVYEESIEIFFSVDPSKSNISAEDLSDEATVDFYMGENVDPSIESYLYIKYEGTSMSKIKIL